jgi:hypothetical protein
VEIAYLKVSLDFLQILILIGGVIATSLPHGNTGAPDRQAHPFADGHRYKRNRY